MQTTYTKCNVVDCQRSSDRCSNGRLGYCSMHYQRLKKFGDPSVVNKCPSPARDWIEENKTHTGNDCLKWPFHVGKDGYGRAHGGENSSLSTASRLMCIAAHGEPPSEKHEAAHSCGNGNKGCTNPNHIYWATPKQNQHDRIAHGTSARGSQSPVSKLKESDVLEIRRLLPNHSQYFIAKLFNVSRGTISCIKSGKNWGWMP